MTEKKKRIPHTFTVKVDELAIADFKTFKLKVKENGN